MSEFKVLFTFKVWDELAHYLRDNLAKYTNLNLIMPADDDEDTILNLASQADVLFGWRPKIELLNKAEKMKLFIQPGTGAEHLVKVFKKYGRKSDVIITNGHGHAYEVAQHALGMLLALTNHIVGYHNQMVDGKWRIRESMSEGLKNKKIGFLGYGPINQFIHKFLSPFTSDFSILKRTRDIELEASLSSKIKFYTTKEKHEFLQRLDVLIIAAPRTKKTENMIGEEELQMLGKNAYLLNVGRGPIINEKALYMALKKQVIKGAAIDVWYNYQPQEINGKTYPYDSNHPFHELENIILSPHRAGSPFGDLSRWDENIQNLITLAEERNDFINVIDLQEEY
ncbi:MAG: Formate dehydrogenase [Candidatus Heimdallarchaeota archaeon LC_2]|nr:MAG: Formate dehydrogenase [Candidatus Heimdallarchaeota archaeon LC_2]